MVEEEGEEQKEEEERFRKKKLKQLSMFSFNNSLSKAAARQQLSSTSSFNNSSNKMHASSSPMSGKNIFNSAAAAASSQRANHARARTTENNINDSLLHVRRVLNVELFQAAAMADADSDEKSRGGGGGALNHLLQQHSQTDNYNFYFEQESLADFLEITQSMGGGGERPMEEVTASGGPGCSSGSRTLEVVRSAKVLFESDLSEDPSEVVAAVGCSGEFCLPLNSDAGRSLSAYQHRLVE